MLFTVWLEKGIYRTQFLRRVTVLSLITTDPFPWLAFVQKFWNTVYSHVFANLSHHNILCDQQHGVRRLRSCESQLILTVNDFAETLNNGEQSDVIFLDFSKAFDKVSHCHLFHKLHHYGIRGDIYIYIVLDWIKNFMLNRSQCVVVDGQQSDLTGVSSGVP